MATLKRITVEERMSIDPRAGSQIEWKLQGYDSALDALHVLIRVQESILQEIRKAQIAAALERSLSNGVGQ